METGANEDLILEAVLIPWEISALNLVLTFWRYASCDSFNLMTTHEDI